MFNSYGASIAVLTVLFLGQNPGAASTVLFTAASHQVSESSGMASITVLRSGELDQPGGVDYTTLDGTASSGIQYSAVAGNLAFGSGEISKTIQVPILNNGLVDGDSSFRVVLSHPTAGASLGLQTNVVVNIQDNDVGIQFKFSAISVVEDGGSVRIGVVRGDDGILPVTVMCSTTDRTAVSGIDYVGVTNLLTFAPQERFKEVPISILNNGVKQSDRSFQVALSSPSNSSLGAVKVATVTIVDNDQGVHFERASITIAENAGRARVKILRGSDDANVPVSVDLATSEATARSGADFLGITNTVTFAPGEKHMFQDIPILNDDFKEGRKTFSIKLNKLSAGAQLGAPSVITVNIEDNDPGVGFEISSHSVAATAGMVNLQVLRGSDVASGPVTVHFATLDGTAKAGKNYEKASGDLLFLPNETIKTLSVPILSDPSAGSSVRFTVSLSAVTGGAVLGAIKVATVSITKGGAFRVVAPQFETALTAERDGLINVLEWKGGGQLQRADGLTGPWQTLASATSPYAVQFLSGAAFFRVTRPRPVEVYFPSSYDGKKLVPLVIALHAYGDNGSSVESYLNLRPLAEARGFLYCYPDSPLDRFGNSIWNSTDAIGNVDETDADDAGFLRGLIEELSTHFAVDPKRIYLIGHSNGGFMAYRMACDSADLIAGIVSLAGATFLDPARCVPSQPVNILHIHGTADDTIGYGGGAVQEGVNLPAYPGPVKSIRNWAGYNQAGGEVTDLSPTLDLDTDLAGLDTVVTSYTTIQPGGAVELWTILGGSHGPSLSAQFSSRILDWLLAHPKP